MSKIQIRVASYILKEHFGDLVENVGTYLLHNGRKTLRETASETNLGKEEVKQSLCVLLQHHIALFEETGKSPTTYKLLIDNILQRLRYPKYVYSAKVLFGDVGELIVEHILMNGADIISRASLKVAERVANDEEKQQKKPNEQIVAQTFIELINGHFIRRVPPPQIFEDESDISKEIKEEEMYLVPPGILQGLGLNRKESSEEPPAKKSKSDSSDPLGQEECYQDEGIYWHVNFNRFHQYMLDQIITSAVSEKIDQGAAKIVATILKQTEMERDIKTELTRSLAAFEIMRKLPSIPKISQEEMIQYMSLLSDQKAAGFVSKTDAAAGGMFCINLKKSIEILCQHSLEQVVQERLGSKACRVFRLLIMKKHLEQKQVGEFAMIPFKETKELLYKLFEERLVKLQEISKSGDYAPSRTFYLFSVNLPQVARLILNRSYQTVGNLMSRRDSEMQENKRLLEKNERIEGILAALGNNTENQEAVIQELEELITPVEKEQLEKLKLDLARLEHGEIQVDETIFILNQYLMFH